MRQRIFILFLVLFVASSLFTTPAFAAKSRVRKQTTAAAGTVGVAYSKARLSQTTNSVVITFLNLNRVKRVTYTLSYTASGIQQGVVGTLVPSGQSGDSRDLYFGTCSHGVCTAHYNIKNVTLLVQTTLTSGATHTKRYRIKV